ncbi:hypothetical protein E2C01_077573 [Portunus trituberculatus]|nr:hypothetical protein [Portunus trituberculatus]
MPSCAL